MIIVDASVAVKWVVSEAGSDEAAALLDHKRLAAPVFWLSEAANALWAKVLRGELGADEARGQATDLIDAPVVPLGLPALLPMAFRLALELGHPVYDCFYLAAAAQNDTYVITADRRFVERVATKSSLSDRIRLLGA